MNDEPAKITRRTMIKLASASLAATVANRLQDAAASASPTASIMSPIHNVPNGQDRLGTRLMVEGVVPLDRKVTTEDTNGGMLIYEHKDVRKGGPPRHLHYDQDEWLYALVGEFVVEIGDERLVLRQGDSVLAPRNVPHAWAHMSDEPATLLFIAQPAGSMEAFFKKISGDEGPFEWTELERIYTAHGMKLLGKPIKIG